jgi:hypothetical protein
LQWRALLDYAFLGRKRSDHAGEQLDPRHERAIA